MQRLVGRESTGKLSPHTNMYSVCRLTDWSSGVEALTDAMIRSCVLSVGMISAQYCRSVFILQGEREQLVDLTYCDLQ